MRRLLAGVALGILLTCGVRIEPSAATEASTHVDEPGYQTLSWAEAREIICVYDWSCPIAMSIAECESGFLPTARNGKYRGLFQLGPEYDDLLQGDVYDAFENTRVAYEVYLRWGASFGAWRACL